MPSDTRRERADRDRSSAVEIHNPAHRPIFDNASQSPCGSGEKRSVRSEGKGEGSIGSEIVDAGIRKQRIVRMAISRVCIRSADFSEDSKVLAPGIGGLKADTPRWPHREGYRESMVVIAVDAGE